jgi:hypothetical protein
MADITAIEELTMGSPPLPAAPAELNKPIDSVHISCLRTTR